jgi:hypothetical protein
MRCKYVLMILGTVLAACAPVSSQPTVTFPVPTVSSPTLLPSPLISPVGSSTQSSGACLPSGIELSSVVSAQAMGGSKVSKVTVQQRLDEIGARCQNGKLVDSAGKEIRFYPLKGCWGNPPDNYQDILQQQQVELDKLRAQYTVIEMTCNPSGLPMQ